MGPPQNVFGSIVGPTRTSRMDKKKLIIKKYEDEISMVKIKAENAWGSDFFGVENRKGQPTDAQSDPRVRYCPEEARRGGANDSDSMYSHIGYHNSLIKQEAAEPQMYSFLKQERSHESVPHAHRLHDSVHTSSYHNDSRHDYYSNYNNINNINFGVGSLHLSSDNSYYSPVHNAEQDRTGNLLHYTNNNIDSYYQNNDYYQSDQLAQSDVFDDRLSMTENYDRQAEEEDMKPDDYDSYANDSYSGHGEDEPLDLTMRRCFPITTAYEEEEEDTLSKQSSEAGSPFYPPDDETDDEIKNLLRKIKTGTRSRVRSPKSWEFLLRMLLDEKFNPKLIRWEDKNIGSFRLVKKDEIAKIWGTRSLKHKDGGLTYDNFARNLRYHYKTKMLLPVSEKHLVYKFGDEIVEQLKKTGTYTFP